LPALYAKPLLDDALLTRALTQINDEALLARIECSLVYLINAAVVAYGENLQDLGHATDVAARARDTLSLGLEGLLSPAGPHPDVTAPATAAAAAKLLAQWHLHDIFRHGHAKAAQLGRAARALAADPVLAAWVERQHEGNEYSEERSDRAFLRALLLPRPLLAGFDPLAPERLRAFASLRELADAEIRLDRVKNRYL